MRAINHALTGATIGLLVPEPAVALPAALASHFVLDAIPHFGVNEDRLIDKDIKTHWFMVLLFTDAILCLTLVAILYESGTAHWLLAASCAFVAALPDFMLVPRFYRAKRYGNLSRVSHNAVVSFHDHLQRQLPLGAVVEVAWLAAAVIVLSAWLHA
ncbi:MAG TPA: hypothetical protein VHD60_04345 [Candidatus Saccharimonadales bacterium]|nr:hypothetical protein [Candidatus Saccharimonadales bacterium]